MVEIMNKLPKPKVEMKDTFQKVVKEVNDISSKALSQADKIKYKLEESYYRPIFKKDLELSSYKMIRIIDEDKKHQDSRVSVNSIGYLDRVKDMDVLTLYRKFLPDLNYIFYPSNQDELFYIHPLKENNYISIDEFFDQIRKDKVFELERIAQCLGACSFKVTSIEEKEEYTKRKLDSKVHTKSVVSPGLKASHIQTSYVSSKIESESTFIGSSEPVIPILEYFKDDSDITSLIQLRMNKDNTLVYKRFEFASNYGTGMNTKIAVNVDFALKKYGFVPNASFESAVEKQNRTKLVYEVRFEKNE